MAAVAARDGGVQGMEEDLGVPMSANRSPRRLVYGPAEYAGYDGIIVEVESAELFGRAEKATTLGNYANDVLYESWEVFLAREENDLVEPPLPDDPFDYSEWVNDVGTHPPDIACHVAAKRVSQLIRAHPDELKEIGAGGGSPGGNMDAITGPLDQLALLATLIDPARDGFTLQRDDALVDLAMARSLYDGGVAPA